MNILADASLPGLEEAFPAPFKLTRYHSELELVSLLNEQDILLCRSTLKVTHSLLANADLKYVATASSGTDHLDHDYLKSRNIQIIDAKGCNASSVADYVVSSLAYLYQHDLIQGKKTGIIGMGCVGTQVHSRLKDLHFDLLSYDPLKSDKAFISCQFEDLYQCDILCIHADLHNNATYPSLNLIDSEFLSQIKPGCIIINASRGGIVNEESLLNTQKPIIYCTDVYLNEPKINPRIIDKATLCTPHIAGHSLEGKYKAVSQVSEQLHLIAGLPIPQYAAPPFTATNDMTSYTWDEQVLSIYNPMHETEQLKSGLNKESAFLSLRKKHNKRHDFALYDHFENLIEA